MQRRIIAGVVVALTAIGLLGADSLPTLFQRGKEEFKARSYKASLATFEELDRLSQQPQFAADRPKIAPAISFYKAANLAALGQKKEAVEQFEAYIAAVPNAALDEKSYPKEIVAAFHQARENANKGGGDIASVYARFRPVPGTTLSSDEKWALTPVRYLLTVDEKAKWATLATSEDRAAFVSEFWQRHDPTPGTPENEFRSEFERRVLFSDAAFATSEARGSETDAAVIFTFFGAPNFVRISELEGAEVDQLRARAQGQNLPSLTSATGQRTSRSGLSPSRGLDIEGRRGRREVWHYRKDRLPAAVTFQELEFKFTTRSGYGERVLDRDERGLIALETVAANTGRELELN